MSAAQPSSYGAEPGILAVAHRGGACLGPENTMEAFQRAVDMGYVYLEADVRLTLDGVAVAFHDRSLRRVTGAPGDLSGSSWNDVLRLQVCGRGNVPRLEELFDAWPDVRWMLDIKQPDALPALVRSVQDARAEHRVCLTGLWDRSLDAARDQLGPAVATALGWRALAQLVVGTRPRSDTAAFAHVPLHFATKRLPAPQLVDRAHARGLRLLVWGVSDTHEMHRLLGDGVDGIITDRIDLLRDAMIASGVWSRPPRHASRPLQPTATRASSL